MTPPLVVSILALLVSSVALFRTFRTESVRESILRGYAYAEQLASTTLKDESRKMTGIEKLRHAVEVAQVFSPKLKQMNPIALRALMEREIHNSKK